MFNPELKPVQPARPGFAVLSIRNWEGDASPVYLSIQRNQDRYFLNDKGEWVGNAFSTSFHLKRLMMVIKLFLIKRSLTPR